jgi:hypothetical protein
MTSSQPHVAAVFVIALIDKRCVCVCVWDATKSNMMNLLKCLLIYLCTPYGRSK